MSTSLKNFQLYGANTSNVYKIILMFKELGIEYDFHIVDIFVKQEQFKPEFLKLNPNNKVPVIVDNSINPPFPVFESGAILVYLAEKYNKFLPGLDNPVERSKVLQWVNWQVANLGPYFGQYFHFKFFTKEQYPYSIERYTKEINRVYNVLDGQLKKQYEEINSHYIVGNELSIADMAVFGWQPYLALNVIEGWETKFPNVKRWMEYLNKERPVFKEIHDFAIKSYLDNVVNKK